MLKVGATAGNHATVKEFKNITQESRCRVFIESFQLAESVDQISEEILA